MRFLLFSDTVRALLITLLVSVFNLSPLLGQDETRFVQLGQDIAGRDSLDSSGRSVSLSADGNRMAVGAPGAMGVIAEESPGYVGVYEWSEKTWVQLGENIIGEQAGDRSGWSVSLSADGNRVAIGAPYYQGVDGQRVQGLVRIYEWSGKNWVQIGRDINDAPRNGRDRIGWNVALGAGGTRVAIGSYRPDRTTNSLSGVRIYEQSGNSWNQLGETLMWDTTGGYARFNVSLSIDGSRVAIGAPHSVGSAVGGTTDGEVRIYEWSENRNRWRQIGEAIGGVELGGRNAPESGAGVSLSADGNRVAVGVRGTYQTGPGHLRIYEWSGSRWLQIGEDIDGESNEAYGLSVSLSANGNRVATGGTGNGAGRVYEWSGNEWVQLGQGVEGEALEEELLSVFKSSNLLSLCANGDRIAIGGWGIDGVGPNAGLTRVYSIQKQSVENIPIRLTTTSLAVGDKSLVIRFPSASGKFYRIEESENLQNWIVREFGVPGIGANIERVVPLSGPKLFLRVSEE